MKYNVKINNTVYEVEVIKGEAQIINEYDAINAPVKEASPIKEEAVAPVKTASNGGTPVTAPLPGQIVEIKVSVGQKVNVGDTIAVLEAMKMENAITSTASGTVSAINAPKGTQVSVGEAIITLA